MGIKVLASIWANTVACIEEESAVPASLVESRPAEPRPAATVDAPSEAPDGPGAAVATDGLIAMADCI